jgi:outer membrane protein
VQIAQSQNYGLISDQFQVVAAHENIKQTAAGNYPVLNAQAAWQQSFVEGRPSLGPLETTTNDAAYAGIGLNFPLIQGGLVVASTRQAIYQYGATSAQFDADDASVVTNTRQSFLGIVSGVGQIRADKQAIISAEQALAATRAGYSVGTRTMVDVLTDTSNLYKAKQRYYDDQYLYLINIFNLKYAAGTLSPMDLVKINSWLNKHINFNLPAKLFTPNSQLVTPRLQTEKADTPIVQTLPQENFQSAPSVSQRPRLQLPPAASTR